MNPRAVVSPLVVGCTLLALAPTAVAAGAAQVALRPAAGPAGTTVVLVGTGFAASRPVLVGEQGRRARSVRASAAGAFTAHLTVRTGRRGALDITTRGGGIRVVNRFVVTAGRSGAGTVEIASAAGRRVRASPVALRPGGLVALHGSGFPGRRQLSLTFLGTTRRVTTARDGRFAASLAVPGGQAAGGLSALIAGAGIRLVLRLNVLAPAATGPPPAGGTGSLPVGAIGAAQPGDGGTTPPSTGPPVNVTAPAISGTAAVGSTLSAAPGTWSGTAPITFAFAWQRCNAAGAACAAIAGATNAIRAVTTGDAGHTLRVVVTARNAAASRTAQSATTALVPAPAPTSGLVAQWHMDEPSGTVMHDAVGGHDGTLHSVTPGVAGFTGTAYAFTHGDVAVPSAAALNPGSANVTITIHLKATAVPATPDWDLIRKGTFDSVGGEYKVEYQPTGQASCGFVGSAGSVELIAGPAVNDGAWHSIACTKTASSIQLTVDGVSFSKAGAVGSIANTADMAIGAHPGSEFFQGALDEASVSVG